MGFAVQGPSDVGISSQTALIVASGSLGYLGESRAPSARLIVTPDDTSASLCRSAGAELSASLSQKRLEGGFTTEALHPGVEDNLLVPWFPGDSVLDSGELSSPVVEVLSPVANTTFAKLYFVRPERDGAFAVPQQTTLLGLELVPYVEGEPTLFGLESSLGGWRLWWVPGSM